MIETIKHDDSGRLVVVAKALTGYLSVTKKISDPESYIKVNGLYDAGFVAHVCAWQRNKGLTPDGVIGPRTWSKIAATAPTCSTSKNRISGPTLAIQILLNGNIACDAIYGPRTKAAVAAFQSYKNLKVDGVCGPKTWDALIVEGSVVTEAPATQEGSTTAGEVIVVEPICEECKIWIQPKDFKQYDSRWGKKMYSNHGDTSQTMANSACGPTAMADIVYTVKDKEQTPYTLAMLAVKLGDRTNNSGTAWDFFIPHIMEHFGFTKAIKTATLAGLKACLDAGGYVVCSMAPGYWTKSGHFICAWKYDDKYVYCNDPASSTRKKQEITQFMQERKQFFCFYPDPVVGEITSHDDEPVLQQAATGTTVGTEIVDVARYQGTINWDKLAPKLALVIIKASGLYRNGADPQYARNVAGAVSHGIPFHAFHFLYCTTEAEAKRDAALFYNTVKAAGHWPLFWVLDCEGEWGVKDKDAAKIAGVFEAELRRLAGADIRVAVYIGHNVYKRYALDYDHYEYVWIPRYGANTGTIEGSTKPDYKCDIWQYTSLGKIDGISGNVDKNVVTGQGHTLEWLRGGEDA